jgi:phospholipid/cholesterol/gamma-HCH transport system permease protein
LNFLAFIGRLVLSLFAEVGRLSLFLKDALVHTVAPPMYFRLIFEQMVRIGYNSLPVVGLTAFFTGGALVLQIYVGGSRFNAESTAPSIVALGITRELGPVLAGLMVAGRVGAAIAAELGTMRVTEQIDALTTLATNPFKYLVAPRLVAAVLTLPVLVLVADTIGVMGGFIVGTRSLGFNEAAVFGFIIALMGCYHGYYSQGGAQGVGRATTNAVVTASILILAANYILTSLLFTNV